jgi:RNA polymerase sigma-70 factor (ECF subfamily)
VKLIQSETYPDWDSIYADNVTRIYALMYRKVGNRPDAEDLTSQVFLNALKPLGITRTVREVRAYLHATARTVLAEHWRSTLGVAVTTIEGDLPGPAEDTDDDGNADARVKLNAILSELPPRQRQILTLRFLCGYTIREAAAELHLTVANAKVLQHRALRAAADAAKRSAS